MHWQQLLPNHGASKVWHAAADYSVLIPPTPNPHFIPSNSSVPLTFTAAIAPPLTYYLALLLLPPFTQSLSSTLRYLIAGVKFTLAIISAFTFIVLPFWYHVPGSATLSYQLGLVGTYGAGRVVDIFFLSWPLVPKRIVIPQPDDHRKRIEEESPEGRSHPSDRDEKYPHTDNKKWKYEPDPHTLAERLWYAFDLMISMRGIGWSFATADVRHDRHPWHPPSSRQLRRALFKLLPILIGCISVMRFLVLQARERSEDLEHTSVTSLPAHQRFLLVISTGISLYVLFDFGYTFVSSFSIPLIRQGTAVADALLRSDETNGMSKALPRHSPNAHNVDFFPLLNPVNFLGLCSLRSFWSKIWHRLFHRAFLIYGVLPMQVFAIFVERIFAKVIGSNAPSPAYSAIWPGNHPDPGRALPKGTADWGKVMGAFLASGIIHAISERCALGGRLAQLPPHHLHVPSAGIHRSRPSPSFFGFAGSRNHTLAHMQSEADASWTSLGKWSLSRSILPVSGAGEFMFFALNGVAVCIEGAVARIVIARRRKEAVARRQAKGEKGEIHVGKEELSRWYDAPVGALWAVMVLGYTGEAFVEGWIRSGIIEELTFLLLRDRRN